MFNSMKISKDKVEFVTYHYKDHQIIIPTFLHMMVIICEVFIDLCNVTSENSLSRFQFLCCGPFTDSLCQISPIFFNHSKQQ